MNFYYDFHIHSCLSPCGDNDMTPYNLVNMAKILGLDIIALTDHNTCRNCEAAIKAGQSIGLTVVPGMELCTSEEVHVVCLFENSEDAMKFSDCVLSSIPPIKNRADIFGEQLIMDETDNVIGTQELLLTTASSISIENVKSIVGSYGGACFPAHIDRSSYSVISNLGMITPEMNFSAVELAEKDKLAEYEEKYPIIKNMKKIFDSDAHYLENMREATNIISLPSCSAKSLIEFLK